MSGLGHLAPALALKSRDPRLPLWALLAASELNDLLYMGFVQLGIEGKASMTISLTEGVRYLSQGSNPWSHGLFMSAAWSLLAAGLAWLVTRRRGAAGMIGLAVMSHWLLDFLMHSNLPLFLDGSPLVGLGLENTGPGFILMTLIDLLLLAGGLSLYFKARRAHRPASPVSKERLPYE